MARFMQLNEGDALASGQSKLLGFGFRLEKAEQVLMFISVEKACYNNN